MRAAALDGADERGGEIALLLPQLRLQLLRVRHRSPRRIRLRLEGTHRCCVPFLVTLSPVDALLRFALEGRAEGGPRCVRLCERKTERLA
jgi:hypothetical protein